MIFISSTQSTDWGDDLLGDTVLTEGYEQGYTIGQGGDCVYDIRVQYSGGMIEEKRKMNLCDLDRVVFNGENAEAAQAKPAESTSSAARYDGSEALSCGRNVNCARQAEVVSKMSTRWSRFSSATHFSSACLDAISRMRSMHPAAWGEGNPGWVQPQMDVCNIN